MDTALSSAEQAPKQEFGILRLRLARHPIAGYYLFTLTITWTIAALLVAKKQG